MELDNSPNTVVHLVEARKALQEKEKFTCPHCDSESVVGHGKYKGRKRYKCKTCIKTWIQCSNATNRYG